MFGIQGAGALLLTALLQPLAVEGLYTKNSPVLQVDTNSYDRLIARSNHVSIVEFYAPWCGHCRNLKPTYEKVAQKLDGLANVAAVDCDDESNKPLCGQMGVQGFPTLKIVHPSKKPGKPKLEDYHGARTAKAIVETVVDRIPNHIKRVTDKDVTDWLETDNSTAKAILFTEKGTTSALLRSLAVDFLGSINFGQVRNKESSAVEKFGINEFPTLVLLPGGEEDSRVYDGELTKKEMSKFLNQVAEPNPDPTHTQGKKKKNSKSSKKSETSTSTSSADSTETAKGSAADEETSSSTRPGVTEAPDTPPLRVLGSSAELRKHCLSPKTGTCVLALLALPDNPETMPAGSVTEATTSLAYIEYKHFLRQAKLFPFYMLPDKIDQAAMLKDEFGLKSEGGVEVIAVNARRGWWMRYDPGEELNFGQNQLEAWIDGIRLGEGQRQKLPEEFVEEVPEPESEAGSEPETPEEPIQPIHEEL